MVSVVTTIKGTAALAKALPKFTKWIDDVLARGGKGALKVEEAILKNYAEISIKIIATTEGKIVIQVSKDLDELYQAAEIANKELKEITTTFATETKGKAGFREGLKSKARAIEKIESDYAGDASKLLDIAGSKEIYETVEDLYSALEKFNKRYKILKIKDRIQNPFNGYRDILMNVQMENGHIVEFRLHLKEMDEVAEGIGHQLYEEVRSIRSQAIIEGRKLSLDEFKKINDLELKSFRLYEEAWKKIIK